MKIADIRVTVFSYTAYNVQDSHGHSHPGPARMVNQALLTVITDSGHEGYAFQSPEQLRPAVVDKYFRPAVIGEDALARERIWKRISYMQRGSGGLMTDRALNALDQALWDLAGRITGQPVYKLLGGFRDRIPAYGSIMCGDELEGGLATPEDYANFAKTLVARGYKAIKIHTWMPPVKDAPSVERDIAACAAVRDAVGSDIALMLDGYHWYSRSQALRIGKSLEELKFAWFEEPMDEASMSSYAWLSSNLEIPVIGPETASGKINVRAEWINSGACDILRAGVLRVGGISPTMKIAHLAEAHGMNCEIHGNGAANLSICLAIENCAWYERGLLHPFSDYETPPAFLKQISDPMDEEGFVRSTELPGLGEDIDFDYIREHTVS